MAELDRSLAQSIVERTMKIIDCNVNVMDAQGVIIASGDLARVGDLHQGALLVLSKQGPVEIDDDLARQLDGARPGVNLPLWFDGRVVGCVGLTGDPGAIRHYGELVRMAAETMLEQAHLLSLLARDARMREELTLGLIRDEALTPALVEWAERLGIDIALPRVAAVIEIDSGSLDAASVLIELQRLHTMLTSPERNNLVATVSLNELVVLKPAFNQKGECDPDWHRQRAETLIARMRAASPLGIRLALGHFFPDAGGLAQSYRVAHATLAVGKQRFPEAASFYYNDLMLPVLLDSLRQGWQAEELRRPLERLLKHDRQGQLLKTLRFWFAHDMQTARTAKALRIHRNTMDYRMRRIEDLCGISLSRTEDCMWLYLALQMASPPDGGTGAAGVSPGATWSGRGAA